ncbi:hypothetical protein ACM9HD_33460 [Streptomyces sp. JAC25]|uniref:hypothetical protein n=1 Tax=Streptomyces sp. JAC25 TaxID=3418413 RepID=UPI003D819376
MSTTQTQSAPSTAVPVAPAVLSLEARLAAVEAAMTVVLDEAAVAYEVRTVHIPTTPVDLTDVVTLPLTPTLQPSAPHTSRR